MDHISIKRLAPGDIAALRALTAVFEAAFDERPAHNAAPGAAYLQAFLAQPQHIVLVAEQHAQVVGGLLAYVLMKPEREGFEIYLYDLAVATAQRRQGVATRLMGALKAQAQALGGAPLYVQAHHEDAPALALYTRLGTRSDVVHFDIE
jgi:aminoglycoside 3-N-acetyltransferase I